MNYAALATPANGLLKSFGLTVKLTRDGVSVGSASAVFTTTTSTDDTGTPSSLLAQTAIRNRTVLLSGLSKEPQVGDTLAADKDSWVVQSVEKIRAATTTVLYKLEVT